ncbi:nucleoside triphosphate hydrolase [Nocardioides speluncae]|uniref:nucleoside triphosphate hydrolase n=1 Tax=Nocardioides speluncae TaxID=2670337 RepID=UPI001F0B7BF8|nr:nucleoside triphosphate hydrolase [Nocardioides speluncae]
MTTGPTARGILPSPDMMSGAALPTTKVSLSGLARYLRLAAGDVGDRRFVLGIAGPPGAGKSTLSVLVRDEINRQAGTGLAEVAPMDGFHLRNEQLDAAGMRARKGEPDTFDAAAYATLLGQARNWLGLVPWPAYDRDLHDPVPGGLSIDENVRIVVTEGNYLLLASEPWAQVRGLLDAAWYLDADLETVRARLLERQIQGGKTSAEVVAKVESSDLPNAHLVAGSRSRAGRVLTAIEGGYRVGPAEATASIQARVPNC